MTPKDQSPRRARAASDAANAEGTSRAQRKSEALLRAVIETAVDGIITIDARGTITSVNPAAEAIFRYSGAEMLGQNVRMLMPEPYRSEHDRYLSNFLETREPKIIGLGREVQGLRKDGSTFPLELAVSEALVAGEQIFVGIVRDVSWRKEQEQALFDSEERLRLMIEGVSDYAIYLIDPQRKIASWNAGAERIFGYSASEILGKSVEVFCDPMDVRKGAPLRDLRLAAEHGKTEEEGPRLRKDRSRFWAHIVTNALYDDRGELTGFVRFVRDVTAKRVSDEALRESAGLLQAVVETAVDGIITIDERGQIISLNASTEKIFGYEAMELMGHNVKVLMPEPYHSEHDGYLGNYLRTRVAKIIGIGREVSGRRKDGSTFPLELSVSETKLEDKTIFTGIVRDITSRKQAEAAIRESAEQVRRLNAELEQRVLERTKQLEAANHEMQGFTYSVSHDLRSPLRAIISTSMVMLQDFGAQLPEEAKELLQRQAGAAQKMATLIDDLLKYSRMAREDLKKQPVDMTEMVHRAASEAAANLDAPLPVLKVEPGILVSADPKLMHFVVENLIGNSIKFARASEPLRIEVGRQVEDGMSILYFRDNGIGIDQKYSHKIFLPFERLVTDKEYPGTGIGLANVRRIIERHGGQVWAEGEPGLGTTIYVELPDEN